MDNHRIKIYEKARQSKDARFDGKFFVAVKTTKIFCRPICPARMPLYKNIEFVESAHEALLMGYRPCLRCRPESAPGSFAWKGTSTTVERALKLIHQGRTDHISIEDFAENLGITSRHLNRLFTDHIGCSVIAYIQNSRILRAKKLLNETNVSMEEVAIASGYNSVRRFNAHFQEVYNQAPSEFKRNRSNSSIKNTHIFNISYRPPYNWQHIINFLKVRAVPGVESAVNGIYERSIEIDGEVGLVRVENMDKTNSLKCTVTHNQPKHLYSIIQRIKRIFDVDVDMVPIYDVLTKDPVLKAHIENNRGLRVLGTWNPFEIAVRAVVGQQVSVVGATTVMGRIVKQYGKKLNQVENDKCGLNKDNSIQYIFPTPENLSQLDVTTLSMPRKRAQALKDMCALIHRGEITFEEDSKTLYDKLLSIKGIGPWTAQYVCMRAINDPDSFLAGDLVLQKAAAKLYDRGERMSEKALEELSETWRPWRAYASVNIWNTQT